MKSDELRQKFLYFFKKKRHKIVPSASLIPDEIGSDQKTLFITAGMQPLVPFLMGQKHPEGKRLVNAQKCLRTIDIDEVGDDTHLTFFEMLGNWSLGDYWKDESIKWSFEFLTKELNIPLKKLAISCFAGDKNAPKDEESAKIWESLGIKKDRIVFLPAEDNWWGPIGDFGPCGPDTEIFYWKLNDVSAPEKFDPKDKNWVEIWNNVFMQYVKNNNGNYVLAEQKNVDTGMGFERTLAILNGYSSVYETDLFLPIIKLLEDQSGYNYGNNSNLFKDRIFRIIVDHVKSSVFLSSEGILPSNLDRGYVLRKLIRRAIIYGNIGPNKIKNFLIPLAEKVIDLYKDAYPELINKKNSITDIIKKEEEKFEEVLEESFKKAEKVFNWWGKMVQDNEKTKELAQKSFLLEQSGGLPVDLFVEQLEKFYKEEIILKDEFWNLIKKFRQEHRELSKTASAGMFKGGLVDHNLKTIKLHTAHHLLLAALQEVFGKTIKQKGSNINSERLRIDFSFDRKLTDEEIKKIEDIVNEKINNGLLVVKREMQKEEAQKIGAEMEFGVKYGDMVSVYFIEDKKGNIFSKEFCGGPHVASTSELGKFKIIKEESLGSGVRRIRGVLK